MKALFLAGGFGTRLRPLTKDLPKPMVPIMGKPLLERNISTLKEHGVEEIVLSTCYQPHKIQEYFQDGKAFDVKISYITEETPLGTAGAIKNAQAFFDESFLVFNADILSDIDLSDMIRFHREKKPLATIAVTEVENPSAYGVIEQDDNGIITAFKEKPQPHESSSRLINAGIYLFEPQLLEEIPRGRAVSIERETYPLLLEKGYQLAVYHRCSYWLDLGTPMKYLKAHKDMLKGKLPIQEHPFKENPQYISPTAKISHLAKIIPPVYIGDKVEVGPFAIIGPETVLCNGASVGMNARVIGSVIWEHARVSGGASVINAVVMSNGRVDRNKEVCNTVITENLSYPIAV